MFYKKKKGMTGISIVMYAVIGLIIITVVLFMVGKNIGNFITGKDKARTCAGACNAGGADDFAAISRDNCVGIVKGRPIGGQYSDVTGIDEATGKPRVCCCYDIPT